MVICCYNGAPYVAEQLASIEAQSVVPEKLRVYEWGSTDNTWQKLQEFLETTTLDAKIFQLGEAKGVAHSFKTAISHLLESEPDVDFIALCDQDDIWEPRKLEVALNSLGSVSPPVIFFSDVSLIDATGNVLAPSRLEGSNYFTKHPVPLNPALFLANPIVGMTMIVSRDVAQKFADMPSDAHFMHDWAMLLCALLMDAEFKYSSQALVRYRQHSNNILGATSSRSKLYLFLSMNNRMKALQAQHDVYSDQFPEADHIEFFSFNMLAHVMRAGFLRKRYRVVLACFLSLGIFLNWICSFYDWLKNRKML